MTILFWLGISFFTLFLLRGMAGFLSASDKDTKLEKLGAAVPGIAGLMLSLSTVLEPKLLSIALIPVLFVGRACYELIVFNDKGNGE